MQERWKSWILVMTSVLDLGIFILASTGVIQIDSTAAETMKRLLVVVVLNILAAANNPTVKGKF